MESKCSFFKLVGGIAIMTSDISVVIPCPYHGVTDLLANRGVGISDISSEVELILASASTFSFPSKISTWTVFPAHRSGLRIG